MMKLSFFFLNSCRLLAILTLLMSAHSYADYSNELNIYSARKEALIKPLLGRFTEETGIAVNLVTGKGDALLTRLQSEGDNSPADILITTDVGRLYRAQQAGVFQAVESSILEAAIPAHLRDSAGLWFGFSKRARVLVYAADRVKEGELSSYEALAEPLWSQNGRGRICIRSSGNIYNQSLVASLIANDGSAAVDVWLQGLVSNFARPPQGGDRDQIKAVAAGQCDVAVVNSYYLGAMLNSKNETERAAAEKVTLFWPNQTANGNEKEGRGVHINISGAGVIQSAPHKVEAIQLLEFLASPASQQWYAEVNNEYPVVTGVENSATLKGWGLFKEDKLTVAKLGELNTQAVKAMDRAGWQ